jgi:CRISPR-associated protein (TIGR02710 family)
MEMCKIQAMLISVGSTEAPVLATIRHHRPEFILFLVTQESLKTRDKIIIVAEEEGLNFESQIGLINNPADLTECFVIAETAMQKLLSLQYPARAIRVDYTAGTKNMTAALALASSPYHITYSYVSGDRTKGGLGTVKDGTEETVLAQNPWETFAIFERRRLAVLWNSFQFKSCVETLKTLSEVSGPYRRYFQDLLEISQGFDYWELFRYDLALRKLDGIDYAAYEYEHKSDSAIQEFMAQIPHYTEQLHTINSRSYRNGKKKERLATPNRDLVLDIFSNARRRFEEGKREDAIVRLYRVVELIAQVELHEKYQVDTSDVIPEQLPPPVREVIQKRCTGSDGKIRIAMRDAYSLLLELDSPLGKAFDKCNKDFKKVQSARNSSILIHGLGASDSDRTYLNLEKIVLSLEFFREEDILIFPKMSELKKN